MAKRYYDDEDIMLMHLNELNSECKVSHNESFYTKQIY